MAMNDMPGITVYCTLTLITMAWQQGFPVFTELCVCMCVCVWT